MQAQKPRLKLHLEGRIEVITPGTSGLTEAQTFAFMKAQSGSVLRYCNRLGMPYQVTLEAMRWHSVKSAGRAGFMRVLLGLPVNPSKASIAVTAARWGKHPLRGVVIGASKS